MTETASLSCTDFYWLVFRFFEIHFCNSVWLACIGFGLRWRLGGWFSPGGSGNRAWFGRWFGRKRTIALRQRVKSSADCWKPEGWEGDEEGGGAEWGCQITALRSEISGAPTVTQHQLKSDQFRRMEGKNQGIARKWHKKPDRASITRCNFKILSIKANLLD